MAVEHIVVDACSTDGTVKLLRTWVAEVERRPTTVKIPNDDDGCMRGRVEADNGRYLFRWVSEPDNGQADAINKGLRMATGDVVCWLNADEYYLPGSLCKVIESFEKKPEADLIYGEPLFVDENKDSIRIKKDQPFDKNILLYYGCYITSCCTFWRRHILDSGHYLNDAYKVTMDFEYWVRLMKLGYNFHFMPKTFAAFMWHNNNISKVHKYLRRKERLKVQREYGIKFPFGCETPALILDILANIYRGKRLVLKAARRLRGDY